MSEPDYHGWLKKIGLAAGQFLARCASEADGAIERTYTLDVPIQSDLPKVAYVCMLTSHQRSEAGEPVLYGDDLSGMLPTVLHPNEFLDGGVIAPYWTMCMDSYSFQNNPIILDLYQRHGTEVDFKGVVVCAAHITRNDRARTVQMAANLVKHVLKADSAVLTKVGGGIPESDLFNILEILEKDGVSTSAVIWSHMGDGSVADSLSVSTPAANALATTGVNDDWVTLSAQTEVIGGGVAVPYFDNAADPDALRQARQVHYREISGAISQVGISRVGFTVV